MYPMEILLSVNALGAIALIMLGSNWLKKYLRQYAS